MKRVTSGFLVAIAAALIGGQPAAADVTIATVTGETSISAYGGRLVWSTYDAAARGYRLTQSVNGVIGDLPVRPRSVPFDVDLGPDASGRPVAVYSRCAREPAGPGLVPDLTDYNLGRGCDIYRFDFADGRETKLARSVNSRAGSEYLPAVWGSRLAFARKRGSRRSPSLYVAGPGDRSRPKRLAVGRRGRGGKRFRSGPNRLDLQGRRLVFGWTYFPRAGERAFAIRLVTPGARVPQLVAETGFSSGALTGGVFSSPVLSDTVYWISRPLGELELIGRIHRYTPTGPRDEASTQGYDPPPLSLAKDDGAFYYVRRADERRSEIVAAGPLAFEELSPGGPPTGRVQFLARPRVERAFTGLEPSPEKPKRDVLVTIVLNQPVRTVDYTVGRAHIRGRYVVEGRMPEPRYSYTTSLPREQISGITTGRRVKVRVRACNRGGCATWSGRVRVG